MKHARALDFPGRTGARNGRVARIGGPVHVPDHVIAVGRIAPEYIWHAVVIEITDTAYVQTAARGGNVSPTLHRHIVQKPDDILSGGVVTPEDIGLAIAVEVGDSSYGPVVGRVGQEVVRGVILAVHVPH